MSTSVDTYTKAVENSSLGLKCIYKKCRYVTQKAMHVWYRSFSVFILLHMLIMLYAHHD
jgi:hypothetical protein